MLTNSPRRATSGTGRVIPINDELLPILKAHRQWFLKHFGTPQPDHYVFPWGSPVPKDPTRPVLETKTAWTKPRKAAKVSCRLHDPRHTYATQLAENGVPESTMLSLMGHMSRTMLERYSHIRMAAKRTAVAGSQASAQENGKFRGSPCESPCSSRKSGYSVGREGSRKPLQITWSHPPGSNRRPADYESTGPCLLEAC